MDRHLDTITRTETAPFSVGDAVVLTRHPEDISTVFDARQMPDGRWVIRAGRDERDYVAAPASNFMRAPSGYRAAPTPPIGGSAYGLSYGAWQDKQAADDADLAYQAALCGYHKLMIDWAHDHAARVNPTAAAEAIKTHTFMLSRAMERLAGRDPDQVMP